ncbi:glycoside hydrolase family 95 protein [Konateibacter massiliensis]|uniref:glycoside hydrolase family 95 protein n=1 Tax=Konateibacter massiliensis TaxID=2002841 RepID=UPI000C145F74|nr:glycoside hydrolase family 95 protein [Konateibacter massiliensis]
MNKICMHKEAKNWNEALPVGNGFMGAMVFGGVGTERIQINEDSVWSGGFIERTNPDARDYFSKIRDLLMAEKTGEAERLAEQSMFGAYPHMRHYQSLGDIWLHFPKEKGKKALTQLENGLMYQAWVPKTVKDYKRSLDIEQSVGTIQYRYEERMYEREFFASNPDKVIVYKLNAKTAKTLNFETALTRKDNRGGRSVSYCDGVEVLDNEIIRLYGQQGGENGIGFELMVMIASTGGRQYRMGGRIVVENADSATLYITARTTYRSTSPREWCLQTLKEAAIQEYTALRQRHINDYQKYYKQSMLLLEGDEKLESQSTPERLQRMREGYTDIGLVNTYYNYAKYLLISSSREHSLPATLQGIWNEDFAPMWGSRYTININIQMNYWLAEKWGLPELHMPLFEHLKQMQKNGKQVADKMYGARGFCCHHNTDIWGDCAPQDSNIAATIWPLGAAWLCLHIVEHYQYTKDPLFIQRYYPVLKDSVLFFLDYMFQNDEGNWVTGPSCSPENTYVSENGEYSNLCNGPVMDLEILHQLFTGYLKITDEIGGENDISQEVKERLDGMPGIKIGKYGQIQEWQKDYEEAEIGHRHISQLFALYPGEQIRADQTPELAKAAELTLRRRLENGGGHTGWSRAWIILFFARLHKSEDAWYHLEELLKNATLDNLFDNHPPFQIDGNFGGACGLLEMLVQDYGKQIYLLPSLPKQLKTGKLLGIRTKCGGILNLYWSNGTITKWDLKAERDLDVTIVGEANVSHYIALKKNEAFYWE